jgi:nucleolar protein 56
LIGSYESIYCNGDATFFSETIQGMERIMNNICSVLLLETGVAVFDDRDNLIFSKKFDNPIHSYRSLKGGEKSRELDQLRQILQSFDFISVNDPSVMFLLRQSGLNSHVMPEDQQRRIRDEKPALMVKSRLASNEMEAMQKLRNFAIEFSSTRVKEASEKLDLHITQAISALDELDKLINVISTRMREWYGLHFPELDNLIQSPNLYAEIVANAGLRQNITRQILEQAGLHDRKVDIIIDAAKRSRGGNASTESIALLKKIANEVLSQSELRRILAEYIEDTMEVVAPNVKQILTALVGARLISKAGSLSKLAFSSASTIQVIGAEKALFRALKSGARPPKHGLLFQHPMVHSAPKWQRGKIARAVASKVAIAARIDMYRQSGKDEAILNKLESRISEIKEKYKNPTSEKERTRKYNQHVQRQQPQFSNMRKDKFSKRRIKSKFGRRRF